MMDDLDKNLADRFKSRDIKPADLCDVRHQTQVDKEQLQKDIVETVAATQSPLLVVPLPNILLLTRRQYDLLQNDPDMLGTYADQRVYVTPLNAMDVRVVE